MSNNPEVVKYFAEGVRSWEGGNIPTARTSFEWCVHLDPEATDALRALAATENNMESPASSEQIKRLWETRKNFGKLLGALNRPADQINARYVTGLWDIEVKLATKSDIAQAYATVMIAEGKWDEALRALKEANPSVPFTNIVTAAVYYRTQRWGDVLKAADPVAGAQLHTFQDRLQDPPEPDYVVQGLSSLMAGEALIRLERYSAGIKRLDTAASVTSAPIVGHAAYLAGLANRALGDEKEADRLLAEALSRGSHTEDIVRAVDDKTFVLDTTSEEMIAARTEYWDASTEPKLEDARAEKAAGSREELLAEAHKELDSFIGMASVKHQIRKLEAKTRAAQAREARGLTVEPVNQHILFTGPPGCIQGDALIAVQRGGDNFHMPLAEVVSNFNTVWDSSVPVFVQREGNGTVGLAELKNAWHSGVKTTYTVTTDSGRTIRATDEHPFLTERGWLRLDELKVEDEVHVRGASVTAAGTPITTEKVVSVEKYGEEDTFDIEVADDPHNFLANGFVVHNTGKTTIARVIGKIYAGLGITTEDKVIETGRPDFVGDTVGSTGLKTKKVIAEAMGGVLFIDEAYALVQETGSNQKDSFGQEALDVLVAEMENNRANLVVIMAGYNRDIERLLATNEGLKSRFSRKIEFSSYSPDEIWEIAELMATTRGATFEDGVEDLIKEQVREVLMTRNHDGKTLLDIAGNGRFVRNVIEGSEEERDLRLLDVADARGVTMDDLDDDELMRISVTDVDNTLERLMKEYL